MKSIQQMTPEHLHKWYLEAISFITKSSYNKDAKKPYEELTEEQKFIDKYICKKILEVQKKQVALLKEELEDRYPTWVETNLINVIKLIDEAFVKSSEKKNE